MRSLGILAAAMLPLSGSAHAAEADAAYAMARPEEMIVSGELSPAQCAELLKPVEAFYAFWATGDEGLLAEAISSEFTDHTLPAGRPQGRPARQRLPKPF